jgi:hypothetical protein
VTTNADASDKREQKPTCKWCGRAKKKHAPCACANDPTGAEGAYREHEAWLP